jgi:hypothetical protein
MSRGWEGCFAQRLYGEEKAYLHIYGRRINGGVGMAKRNDRRWAWLWFPGILGLILIAIGLRYASSSGWWPDVFGGGPQDSQTINSGANVFMSTTTSPSPSPSSDTTKPNTGLPYTSPPTPAPSPTGSGSGVRGRW